MSDDIMRLGKMLDEMLRIQSAVADHLVLQLHWSAKFACACVVVVMRRGQKGNNGQSSSLLQLVCEQLRVKLSRGLAASPPFPQLQPHSFQADC